MPCQSTPLAGTAAAHAIDTPTFPSQMEAMSAPRNRLSDPVLAARAWARFRWIMRWVIVAAILSVAASIFYLWADGSPFTVAIIVATIAGVSLSVLLGGGLMGLIFMSAGSGHDEDAARHDGPGDHLDRRR